MLTDYRIRVKLFSIDPFLDGKYRSNTYICSLRLETVASRHCLPENNGPLLYVNVVKDYDRYDEKGESLGEDRQWPGAKGKSWNRSTRPRSTASLTGNYSLKTERTDEKIVQRLYSQKGKRCA